MKSLANVIPQTPTKDKFLTLVWVSKKIKNKKLYEHSPFFSSTSPACNQWTFAYNWLYQINEANNKALNYREPRNLNFGSGFDNYIQHLSEKTYHFQNGKKGSQQS